MQKIEEKRKQLHKELSLQDINTEKILKISQELDELIVEYHKNGGKEDKN